MTWSTPPTWTTGQVITSAALNILRDCLLETAPAKAAAAGRIFVSSGVNSIVERQIQQDYEAATGTTTSTSFTDLGGGGVGPHISATPTGPLALVAVQAMMSNSTNGASTRMSFDVGGATSSSAVDDRGTLLQHEGTGREARFCTLELQTLTSGNNTFTAKYRVSSGTGSYQARTLVLIPL